MYGLHEQIKEHDGHLRFHELKPWPVVLNTPVRFGIIRFRTRLSLLTETLVKLKSYFTEDFILTTKRQWN